MEKVKEALKLSADAASFRKGADLQLVAATKELEKWDIILNHLYTRDAYNGIGGSLYLNTSEGYQVTYILPADYADVVDPGNSRAFKEFTVEYSYISGLDLHSSIKLELNDRVQLGIELRAEIPADDIEILKATGKIQTIEHAQRIVEAYTETVSTC